MLSEVTKGSPGLTRELRDSLSDFTVSAQTEPGAHGAWFIAVTEYLTFGLKKKKKLQYHRNFQKLYRKKSSL